MERFRFLVQPARFIPTRIPRRLQQTASPSTERPRQTRGNGFNGMKRMEIQALSSGDVSTKALERVAVVSRMSLLPWLGFERNDRGQVSLLANTAAGADDMPCWSMCILEDEHVVIPQSLQCRIGRSCTAF